VPALTRFIGLVAVFVVASGCDGVFRFDENLPTADAGGPLGPADASPFDDGPAADAPLALDAARVADAPAADLPTVSDLRPDRAPDLGVDRPFDLPPDEGGDSPLVGWTPDRCMGAGCNLECRANPSCSGACGATCHARCRNSTGCSLTTADDADLECREGATCAFVISGGSVRCREGARCSVRCLGACTLNCEDARCTLRCAADTALRTVTGTARCP
jgi:hypothetical protein